MGFRGATLELGRWGLLSTLLLPLLHSMKVTRENGQLVVVPPRGTAGWEGDTGLVASQGCVELQPAVGQL